MSRIRWLLFLMFGCSCGGPAHDVPDTNPAILKPLQQIRDHYIEQYSDQVYIHRCDKLTFAALHSALGACQDMSRFEWPEQGRLNRDTVACYPDESKSTVSRDSYIMLAHHWLNCKDLAGIDRALAYAEAHGYSVGEGPFTNITPLLPLLYSMQRQLTTTLPISGTSYSIEESAPEENSGVIEQQLQGFRGHLLAFYIHAVARIRGACPSYWQPVLSRLAIESAESPLILAIVGRWLGGTYTDQAVSILTRDYQSDTIVYDDGAYGWGSLPHSLALIIALRIIEGG